MYAERTAIQKAVGGSQALAELTTESGSEIDWDVVESHGALADAEIDGYCARLYHPPFTTTVPQLVKQIGCDIVVYRLFEAKGPELAKARESIYLRAIRQLRAIADGSVVLTPTPAPSPQRPIKVVGGKEVFSRTRMRGW